VADHLDLARSWLELWNGGQREGLEQLISPDFELHGPFSAISGEPYRGTTGFRRWLADVEEQFEEWELHAEPRELSADCVLLVGHVRARGRASGFELEQSAAALVYLRDDRVLRVRILPSEADALGAFAAAD
jgi:ketosteroid isomerase-like protein